MIYDMKQKYYNDPIFHAAVDIIIDFLEKSELTASELREAAMLAAEIYESTHIRPLRLSGFGDNDD